MPLLLSSARASSKAAAGSRAAPPAKAFAPPRRARTCAVVLAAAADCDTAAAATAAATNNARLASRRSTLAAVALAAAAAAVAPSSARADEAAADATTCTYATLANGLQWCDLRVGDGPSPVAGAMIRAHYKGVLASNGREFDSSYSRGKPLSFPVGKGAVIKGWDLSILGDAGLDLPAMKEGGKRRVILPSSLAYGDRGAGGVIPPGAALDFVIELMPKRRN